MPHFIDKLFNLKKWIFDRFAPSCNIVAHHDSIMKVEYGVSFFKQFALCLNALDNCAARNHVNRMCLAANIPLVESGTAGYLGQVMVIKLYKFGLKLVYIQKFTSSNF